MIGSGIFIVSADIAHQVRSPGLLLAVWIACRRNDAHRRTQLSANLLPQCRKPAASTSISANLSARSGAFSTAGQCFS